MISITSKDINTGGPAFPFGTAFAGMTLRDYFAAKAMQSIVTMDHVDTYESAADRAYAMADAMLKARND